MVSPVFPWPLTTGTKVRLYNLIKALRGRGHQIGLAAMLHHDELAEVARLQDWFADLVLVPVRAPGDPPRLIREPGERFLARALKVASLWLRGLPLPVALMYQPRLEGAIARLLPAYDRALVEFFFMAVNLPASAFGPERHKLMLVEHDLTFMVQRRRHLVARGWQRLALRLNAFRYYKAEVAALRRFGRVAVMSEEDGEAVRRVAPEAKVAVVPNGVDLERYVFQAPVKREDPPKLLFVGGLAHRPNFDALGHFLGDFMPRLAARFSGLGLTVVGDSDGAGELATLPGGRFTRFTGPVPELTPYFRESTALVVPLRIAGGTRLKIIEAMAAGLPVISSAVGAEGLAVEPGKHLLVAETPEDYLAALDRLLNEPGLAVALAAAARRLCEERYDWRAIAAGLEEALLTEGGQAGGR